MTTTSPTFDIVIPDLELIKTVDWATKIIGFTVNPVGMFLNLLLGYLILTSTPPVLKAYSVLLLNFAFFDFLCCLCGVLALQKVVFGGFALTYIFHGPCGLVSPGFCYLVFAAVCQSFAHSQWILMLSFIYRYYILVRPTPSVRKMVQICALFYFVTMLFLGPYFLDCGDSEVLLKNVVRVHPQYHFENRTIWPDLVISGNESLFSTATLLAVAYMCVPCFPIYAVVVTFRHKTLAMLDSSTLSMSEQTRKSHRQLIKALTLQAVIPVFWMSAASLYLAGTFGLISSNVWVENATFRLMEFMPVMSPFFSLYFIAPYRNAINKLMRRNIVTTTPKNLSQLEPQFQSDFLA